MLQNADGWNNLFNLSLNKLLYITYKVEKRALQKYLNNLLHIKRRYSSNFLHNFDRKLNFYPNPILEHNFTFDPNPDSNPNPDPNFKPNPNINSYYYPDHDLKPNPDPNPDPNPNHNHIPNSKF